MKRYLVEVPDNYKFRHEHLWSELPAPISDEELGRIAWQAHADCRGDIFDASIAVAIAVRKALFGDAVRHGITTLEAVK